MNSVQVRIADWQQGDADARDRVFTHLYPELRRLANAVLRDGGERARTRAEKTMNEVRDIIGFVR